MNSEVPLLIQIQEIQHSDVIKAQEMTMSWFKDELGLEVESVTLTPQPTSLNSFNGVAMLDGEEIFFKSHTEPDSAITEYYNSNILSDAGYNVVKPLRSEHVLDQQIVFYPVIKSRVMFDIMHEIDVEGDIKVPKDIVLKAEEDDCKKILGIYKSTLKKISAKDNSGAPVHQLFWHRLTGKRFKSFYDNSSLILLDGESIPVETILNSHWIINGVQQPKTLNELILEATKVLDPNQESYGAIGHGDAHFGNVFLEDDAFLYFDPAFAGTHSPLLDIVKPIFHNVFAQWMYFPKDIANNLDFDIAIDDGKIVVDYSNVFPSVRKELYDVKKATLLNSLLSLLLEKGESIVEMKQKIDLALMCCPLLTLNLMDTKRFPTEISWLGFALCLQMGNGHDEQNYSFNS